MKKETYERQKAFAGEKKASMKRRCVGHDYTRRGIYMLTMVVEGRRPLFAHVYGTSDNARIELTPLGAAVRDEWWSLPKHHPQIEVFDLQMMPDHLHGILYVREQMACGLSRMVRGFKTGCGRHYRRLVAPLSVATESQQTMKGSHPKHGLLFEPGFNDRILKERSQLAVWRKYLRDNPRRLLMKREHPDLFRVQRGVTIGDYQFSAIGNLFLLERPDRIQVQCSRSLTEEQITEKVEQCLELARQGAVLVSPSISKGEKQVMRAAFEEGLPLIVLQENGFTDLAKPGGKRMEACASGQLLLLAPWEHHNERLTIRRGQCLALNDMARMICER
jgi:REP element-mobilizing transposase RayT